MSTIIIEDYSPQWPVEYERLKKIYEQHLGHLAGDIQHVGSTSVPGLSAKPILDIDIIIDDENKLPTVIKILEGIGYAYAGDLGIKDRYAFRAPSSSTVAHHLYVCLAGSDSLLNHLKFRDYLRANPEAAAQYGTLKKQLAIAFADDIDGYVEQKTAFITGVLERSGFAEDVIKAIALQNRKSR